LWTTVRQRRGAKGASESIGVLADDIDVDCSPKKGNPAPHAGLSEAAMSQVWKFVNDLKEDGRASVAEKEEASQATREETVHTLDWNAEKEAEQAREAEEQMMHPREETANKKWLQADDRATSARVVVYVLLVFAPLVH
jgi:hypothetical protein